MGGKSKQEGIYVYVWLSHFALQQKTTNTVKQLYSNKNFFFVFKERNHNGFKETTGLFSDSLPDMLRVEFAGQKGMLRSLISFSARALHHENGDHLLGAGSYSPCAPASRSSYPEPTPALLWSPPQLLPADSPACWSGVHTDSHLLAPKRKARKESISHLSAPKRKARKESIQLVYSLVPILCWSVHLGDTCDGGDSPLW